MAFTLRLRDELDERLRNEAQSEHRSKQDQISSILEDRYGMKQTSAAKPKRATTGRKGSGKKSAPRAARQSL